MSSLLAIYAFDDLWNISNYVRYGFMALQHRGLEIATLCRYVKDSVICNTVEDLENLPQDPAYSIAIAALHRDRSIHDKAVGRYVGNGIEVAVLADRAYSDMDGLAEVIAKALGKSGIRAPEALSEVFSTFIEAPSILALTSRGEVIIWRSSSGLSPLSLGGYGFDMALVSSESVAIDILGGEIRKHLSAGEGLYIHKHLVYSFRTENNDEALCSFELLYLSRPDALIKDFSVYSFRKRLGVELAKRFDKEVDVVVGVPETALPYAIGFSQALGKPYEIAFVPTGSKQRSMLKLDPRERIIAIHLKMNTIRGVLEGKRVALIDDSMVTGSTIKTVAEILRFSIGVDELHLVIASPPLVCSCPYKLFQFDKERLLAANLSNDIALKYLEVDSLTWIDPAVMDKIAREFSVKLCAKCFNRDFFGA